MAETREVEIKTKTEVVVCTRCDGAKEDAKKLVIRIHDDGDEVLVTPEDYHVCRTCAQIVKNSLTMVKRPRQPKPKEGINL